MADKKTPLIAGMIILLALVGTTYYITNIDQTYYCEDRNIVSMCFKLSNPSNNISSRCYYNESTPTKYMTCTTGWKPIKDFPEIMNNLTIQGNITPQDEYDDWVINGSSVYINNQDIYLSITPHTVVQSQPVNLVFNSKNYTGNIDLVFGFDNPKMDIDNLYVKIPVVNITTESNYTCPTAFFNYTLTPKIGYCYENITTYDNQTMQNVSQIVLIYEHTFDRGNLPAKTIYWNSTTQSSEWKDYRDTGELYKNYSGMTKWEYIRNIPVVKGTNYYAKVNLEIPIKLGSNVGKYSFAVKPSSETIDQAIANGHLYMLDPWYSGNWSKKKQINVSDPSLVNQTNAVIDVNVNFSDTLNCTKEVRVFNSSETGEIASQVYNESYSGGKCISANVVFLSNLTTNALNVTTFYVYYANANAVVPTYATDLVIQGTTEQVNISTSLYRIKFHNIAYSNDKQIYVNEVNHGIRMGDIGACWSGGTFCAYQANQTLLTTKGGGTYQYQIIDNGPVFVTLNFSNNVTGVFATYSTQRFYAYSPRTDYKNYINFQTNAKLDHCNGYSGINSNYAGTTLPGTVNYRDTDTAFSATAIGVNWHRQWKDKEQGILNQYNNTYNFTVVILRDDGWNVSNSFGMNFIGSHSGSFGVGFKAGGDNNCNVTSYIYNYTKVFQDWIGPTKPSDTNLWTISINPLTYAQGGEELGSLIINGKVITPSGVNIPNATVLILYSNGTLITNTTSNDTADWSYTTAETIVNWTAVGYNPSNTSQGGNAYPFITA